MCGIAGFFGFPDAKARAEKALDCMQDRGLDCRKVVAEKENAFGHLLHSVVGSVEQPLRGKGVFASNCEIYNWKELAKRHKAGARNDSELVFRLLERENGTGKTSLEKTLAELDGIWAFSYWRSGKVFLSRDLFGVKPLFYSIEGGFCFASEKKALEAAGAVSGIRELDPRHVLVFDLKTKKAEFLKRPFLKIKKLRLDDEGAENRLIALLSDAVEKRVPEKSFGLLFSGGVDSLVLAVLFKKMNLKFKCFFAFAEGAGEPKDLAFAQKAARRLDLDLETVPVKLDEVPGLLEKVVPLIESSDPVRAGVALPVFAACREAKRHGVKVIFSGLGADEIFCGYARFRQSNSLQKDSLNLLLQMHENDLYRDDVVSMNNSIELRLPFLDKRLAEFALSLPDRQKIEGERNKAILRNAALALGIPAEFAERGKIAAQYGSNFDKALERLAKKSGSHGKAAFLQRFAARKNMKLAALFSGGKDSCLALWTMQRMNYEISCLVSIIPENPDSFMYHRPDERILALQAEALGIPLVVKRTKGEKEKELVELKSALAEAKKKFGTEGAVSGALYSNYQRDRIQEICNDLHLRLFSPLWHKKQEEELLELVDAGFEFVMIKIAAYGLDESWLGKPVGKKEIEKLAALGSKIGFNCAGEGGEFESLVLDAPNFKKRLKIVSSEKKMRNAFSGELEIREIGLEAKP
ncbi:MAG: diphthine--ammonia ligase [Candidatus Diapherotrites archaeon]|nr:diphthine--ammonia ligase [Candidatus Diapherotrites archaeon]